MTKIELFNPPELSPPIGFSHAAAADAWVWLGGQIGCDAHGVVQYPGDMTAQFRQAIRNVGTALAAANCRPEGVVKITYYVTDVEAYRHAQKDIGRAYREVMGRHYPAASLFMVAGLFEPDAMVEIECVARQIEPTEP